MKNSPEVGGLLGIGALMVLVAGAAWLIKQVLDSLVSVAWIGTAFAWIVVAVMVCLSLVAVVGAVVYLLQTIAGAVELLKQKFVENIPVVASVMAGLGVGTLLTTVAEKIVPKGGFGEWLWPICFGLSTTLGSAILSAPSIGWKKWLGAPLLVLPGVVGVLMLIYAPGAADAITAADVWPVATIIVILVLALIFSYIASRQGDSPTTTTSDQSASARR